MASNREPTHIFSIPTYIVDSLKLRQGPSYGSVFDPIPSKGRDEAGSQTPAVSNASFLACASCQGAAFSDVDEQRAHFRSDWHRYNVKARLKDPNFKSMNEAEFGELVEGKCVWINYSALRHGTAPLT
jgi:hypothetical protein